MNAPRRVTLADIAAKAKVHVTTVSLVLRDHPRIPEKTKKRIRALAEKMGYVRDPFLCALASYRTRERLPQFRSTIGYLTNWATEWGWKKATGHLEFFQGAERMARELGYALEHFWLRSPELDLTRLAKILKARGISGLVIASHGLEIPDSLNLDWGHFSCMKIDYFPHHPQVHNVTNDQSSIVRLAIRKAIAAGYRRIGMVMHRGWDHAVDQNLTAGYLCEQQNIPEADRVPALIYPALYPVEGWQKKYDQSFSPDVDEFKQWMDWHKPEVILSNADFVRPVFNKLRIKVPQDVSFVDLFLSAFDGTTAGVRQNYETVGALTVEFVSAQMAHSRRGIPEFPTTTFVEGTWFDGASCPTRGSSQG